MVDISNRSPVAVLCDLFDPGGQKPKSPQKPTGRLHLIVLDTVSVDQVLHFVDCRCFTKVYPNGSEMKRNPNSMTIS